VTDEPTYNVPTGEAESKLTEKGSVFLGWAVPIANEADAQTALAARSKKYHNATHHCWAFRAGEAVMPLERYADAGEPSGSAGLPILQQIRKRELLGCLVVVTRWFGGTKLGVGGLVRAYGDCAAAALDGVAVRTVKPERRVQLECSYDQIGIIEHTVAQHNGVIDSSDFGASVRFVVILPLAAVEPFLRRVKDLTAGRVTGEIL